MQGDRRPSCRLAAAVFAVVTLAAGCAPGPLPAGPAAGPMNRPVAINPNAGAGATESARRELQGTWELVTVEWAPTANAPLVAVQATGTLVYDEFGNLTIDARTADPAAPVAAREVSALSFRGRAVIDAVNRELQLMDLEGNVNPGEVLAPERRRRFDIQGDTLTLSSFDDRKQVTAVTTWHRRR